MNIAIYGAGGFGKEVACLIDRINRNGGDWHLIGFFDDTKPAGTASFPLWQGVTMGEGNIIQNDCMISCDVVIGSFNLINDHVVVGHDNVIGDFNGLMPAAHLSGGITIGNNNLLGVASVVLQGMTIGNGVTLGANSVLMTQPRDNSTYLGVPAKRFDF